MEPPFNLKQKETVNLLKWFAVILLVILVVVNLAILIQFYKSSFSNNIADWGSYGSFVSGITSILNLALFAILTIYLAKLGDDNNEKQLQLQKEISEQEIKLQKAIRKADDRKSAINVLNQEMTFTFTEQKFDGKLDAIQFITDFNVDCQLYLDEFKNLFPTVEYDKYKEAFEPLTILSERLNGYMISEGHFYNTEGNRLLRKYKVKKSFFIKTLRTYTTNEFNKLSND